MPPQSRRRTVSRRRGLRLPAWVPLCLAAGARAQPQTCAAYDSFAASAFEALGISSIYRTANFSRTEASIEREPSDILIDVGLGAITLGAAPAPLAGEAPGENLIVLCSGKSKSSWSEFQAAARELLDAIAEYRAEQEAEGEEVDGEASGVIGDLTAEILLDHYVCSERLNGLTLPSAGHVLPVLPPPVFLYAQRVGVVAVNATLDVVKSDGSTVRMLTSPLPDSGSQPIYPFGETGRMLGPGVVGPFWDDKSCAIAITSELRRPPNASAFYTQLTLGVGAADMLANECYDRKCTYMLQRQYSGGFTAFYDVSQGLHVHEKNFEGASFRVSLPSRYANAGAEQRVRAQVGFVDDDWHEFVLQETIVHSGQTWKFNLGLNQTKRDDCAVPKCPRFFDNRTVTDPCGVCPWRLFVTVWPLTEPLSLGSAIATGFNNTPCLEEDPRDPSCIPVMPLVLVAIESREASNSQWFLISILLVLIVFGSVSAIICFVDVFLLKHRSRTQRGLHLCSCICLRACPAETLRLLCCFNRGGCVRLCVWIGVKTKWLVRTLWHAAGSTPPGHFPLQVVVALILWLPFIIVFPGRIDALFAAFINFTDLFLNGDPIFVQSKEVLALIIGVIITYGIVMMVASWHISWTARELALGRHRPRTIYQWARAPTDKPPDNVFTRHAYHYAEKNKVGHMCGERSKACRVCCCFCLGRWSVSCLDLLVYCPHACMVAVTAGLFAIAVVLLVAAVPTRALADVLGAPLNLTSVEAVWEDVRELLTPELTLEDEVAIVGTLVPEILNPPECLPPEDAASVDRTSFSQLVLLPMASTLVIHWYQNDVADPAGRKVLEDAVYRVENSLSDSLAAPADREQSCNQNTFYSLLYLDMVRIFIIRLTRGAVSVLDGVVNIGDTLIIALSGLSELTAAMYRLADETEGLMFPTLCAMIAMALSLNVWARSYGFIKGYEYRQIHGAGHIPSESGDPVTDADADVDADADADAEQGDAEKPVPPPADGDERRKRADTRTATDSVGTSELNTAGQSGGSVEA